MQHEASQQRTLGVALAIIVGLIPAFFIVFRALVSDVPPQSSAASSVVSYAVVVLVSYAVAGAAFGYIEPGRAAGWGFWLSLPVVFPLAVAIVRERQRTLEIVLYALLALCAAAAAAYAASRLRRPMTKIRERHGKSSG
jgi:hypothetical protein